MAVLFISILRSFTNILDPIPAPKIRQIVDTPSVKGLEASRKTIQTYAKAHHRRLRVDLAAVDGAQDTGTVFVYIIIRDRNLQGPFFYVASE